MLHVLCYVYCISCIFDRDNNTMAQIRIIIYSILVLIFIGLIGFGVWLVKERDRLMGYESAFKVQSAALENANNFVQTHTSLSAAMNASTLKEILKENAKISQELKTLGIRAGQVSAYLSFATKQGKMLEGIATDLDSLKVLKVSNEFGKTEVTYDPKNDSITVKDSTFADFDVIFHSHRKKFLGIGLGKRIFETTITTPNKDVVIGNVRSYQAK